MYSWVQNEAILECLSNKLHTLIMGKSPGDEFHQIPFHKFRNVQKLNLFVTRSMQLDIHSEWLVSRRYVTLGGELRARPPGRDKDIIDAILKRELTVDDVLQG